MPVVVHRLSFVIAAALTAASCAAPSDAPEPGAPDESRLAADEPAAAIVAGPRASDATIGVSYTSGQWRVTATNAGSVTISGLIANGYARTSCGGGAVESDQLSATLPTGTSDTRFPTNAGTALDCQIRSYRLGNAIRINGILVANGAAVLIGGINYHVTISPTACSPYPC